MRQHCSNRQERVAAVPGSWQAQLRALGLPISPEELTVQAQSNSHLHRTDPGHLSIDVDVYYLRTTNPELPERWKTGLARRTYALYNVKTSAARHARSRTSLQNMSYAICHMY